MLVIGIITCHRPGIDVHQSIGQLRWGGFGEPVHLFCEPNTPEVRPLSSVVVHRNEVRCGVLGNWAHCLTWLLRQTTADYLMVCEDDVAYARGARAAWATAVAGFGDVGYWSFYTPVRDEGLVGHRRGWVAANRGRDAWGTQAMCFPRSSAELVLAYQPLRAEDQLRGPTDAIVAQCFLDAGLPCYYHNPSLADHVGRVSSVDHNWHDDHVGLDFDQNFEATIPTPGPPKEIAGLEVPSPATPAGPRLAVVTVYQDNIPTEVVDRQAEVIGRFLPDGCEFEPRRAYQHAQGLDDYFRTLRYDAYLVLDIDCIPLAPWVMPWLLGTALAGVVVGAAQRANHLCNDGHLYAGPCAVAFSRATFERLGRPSFRDTSRGDVGEELTYSCEQAGVPVSLLWPTSVALPKWTLRPGIEFGLGTTFGGALYHAFEISKGQTVNMFLDKCREVLGAAAGADRRRVVRAGTVPAADSRRLAPPGPVFHEEWYSESELDLLNAAVRFVRPLQGQVVEIGCWEGRSTAVIANACFPDPVVTVDTWRGNVAESADHETVRLARERDVFAVFRENMHRLTRGNVVPEQREALEFLRASRGPIKFCHIDAAHDYESVRTTILEVLPRLARGGILVGHDYETAHAGRADLGGGVQRAVREVFPNHVSRGNNWWYVHMTPG
jgi:predicted O-methyltransferase YrrM